MTLSVDVWSLDDEWNPEKVGTIQWDGNEFTLSNPKDQGLQNVMNYPAVLIDQSVVLPNEEPEKFMRSLYLAYYSQAFHCSRAKEIDDG